MKKIFLCLFCALFSDLVTADTVLENRFAAFRFSEKNGALLQILNKETGRAVEMPGSKTFWQARLLDAKGNEHLLTPSAAPVCTINENGKSRTLTMTWRDLAAAGSKVSFSAQVTLPEDSGIAVCRGEISTAGKQAAWVKTLHFPVLSNLKTLGDDFLIYGDTLGRIVRTPGSRVRHPVNVPFPGHWSMQFAAFYGSARVNAQVQPSGWKDFYINGFYRGTMPDETGVFLACADREGMAKSLNYQAGSEKGTFTMETRHLPPLPFWPITADKVGGHFRYAVPYDIHLGPFTGGRGRAAELYRNIVRDYPFVKNATQSRKISDNAFWSKSYGGANKIVPELLHLKEFLQIPVNVHMVRWYCSSHDDNNLDYYPMLGQIREGIRDMRLAGIGVAPYLCCAIWDSDTESYVRKNIAKAVALKENGKPYIYWIRGPHPWMNPASPLWRKEYADMTEKVFSQIFSDSQYLDVMAVGQQVCYNNELKTINGGNYWARGNCQLLDDTLARLRKITPDPFLITEGFCESYIGKVSCFLIHDLTRYSWAHRRIHDAFPLFPMIYNDVSSIYGSDCEQTIPLDFFRWQMGTSFVWGIQLCYGGVKVLDFGSVPHDHYARNLAHAWYRAGYPYLGSGVALETALVKDAALLGKTPFGVVGGEHQVFLKQAPFLNFPWRGPAVQAMTYRSRIGNTAVIMTNITGKEQKCTLHIDGNALPKEKRILWRSWPLPLQKIGEISGKSVTEVTLPVDGACIYEMRGDGDVPVIRDLLKTDVVPMIADKQGKFASRQAVEKGQLYGCDSVYTRNADGELSLIHSDGTPVTAKYFNWFRLSASNSGTGGPRGDVYRSFYTLQKANISVKVSHQAVIRTTGKVSCGSVESSGRITLDTVDGWRLLAHDGRKLRTATGALILEPGKWRILAFASDLSGEKNLCKAARQAAEQGEKLLTGGSCLPQATTLKGEDLLALANGITFLLTGREATVSMENDALIPGIPKKLAAVPEGGKWTVLNRDLAGFIKTDGGVLHTEGIGAANNFIRLLYRAETEVGGDKLPLTVLRYIEVMEPLHAEIDFSDAEKQIPVGVQICSNAVSVTNVSPEPLNVVITAAPGGAWQLEEKELRLTIPPITRRNVRLNVRRKEPVVSAGEEKVRILLNYSGRKETGVSEEFTVISQQMRLEPVGKGIDPEKFSRKTANIRSESMFAVRVGENRKFTVELEFPLRNGKFQYQLHDASMKPLERHSMPVTAGMVKKLDFTVPAPGIYFISMQAPFFRLRFKGVTHYAFNCGGGRQYNTFEMAEKFFFMLNADRNDFEFCGVDGGPSEPAEVIIRDGSGKLKFYRSGRFDGEVWKKIKPGASGVWTMEVIPEQDFGFKMRNGSSGWVSTEEAALLKAK